MEEMQQRDDETQCILSMLNNSPQQFSKIMTLMRSDNKKKEEESET